jgi:hypothetical protein
MHSRSIKVSLPKLWAFTKVMTKCETGSKEERLKQACAGPKPGEFALSLAACVPAAAGTCPLGGHEKEKEISDEEESKGQPTDCLPTPFQ